MNERMLRKEVRLWPIIMPNVNRKVDPEAEIILSFLEKYTCDYSEDRNDRVKELRYLGLSSTEFREFPIESIKYWWHLDYENLDNLVHVMKTYNNIFFFDIYVYDFEKIGGVKHVKLDSRFILTLENLNILYINNVWGKYDLNNISNEILRTLYRRGDYELFLDMFLLLRNVVLQRTRNEKGADFFNGKVGYYLPMWTGDYNKAIYDIIKGNPVYHDNFILLSADGDFKQLGLESMLTERETFLCTSNLID